MQLTAYFVTNRFRNFVVMVKIILQKYYNKGIYAHSQKKIILRSQTTKIVTMKKILFLCLVISISTATLFAQPIYNEAGIRLYHTPSQEEMEWAKSKGLDTLQRDFAPPPVGELRPIAEFEPAEAVLIRYPFGIPISLIKEMAKDIKVITIVASESQQTTVLNQYTNNNVNTANCEFLTAETNTYWTRDYGPWFMAIDNSGVGVFDFYYNRPARPNDNQVNKHLANYLSLNRYASNLWLTGGNYMNDGIQMGFSTTLVTSENLQHLGLNESQIKAQLQEYLGLEQYHFIADPIYPYDNIQHIDCWSKLLAPDKVLVARVPASNPSYNKFENAANYFASLTSSWGTPMQVFRVDAPGATSSSPTTPYTNSLILNNKVFVAINATTNANDLAALAVYEEAMPGYEIIGINYNGWLNTDALHCRTHEIADRCMLYIKHQPHFADMENTGSVTFSAELYSYCNNAISYDSVYIRVNGGAYQPYEMQYVDNNTWSRTVTGLPNGLIEYYLVAKDESGKRECHPYIGAPDPHKFNLVSTPELPVLAIDKTSSSVTSEEFTIIEDYITISNVGEAELTFNITDIVFDEMLTITPLDGTLEPNASQIITLSYNFAGVANGEYNGSFKLLSNDPLHLETEITLHAIQDASMAAPILSLDKTSSSVSTEELTVVEDFITVSNLGNADLTFEITEIDFNELLTIMPLDGTVAPDQSLEITLSYDFRTIAKGDEYSGSFILKSNDPETPEVEITLYAYVNVGINENELSLIYIYPNPASDKLIVKMSDRRTEICDIEIFDVMGKKLLSHHLIISSSHQTIDISHLSAGVYFIKIEDKILKFVKQ